MSVRRQAWTFFRILATVIGAGFLIIAALAVIGFILLTTVFRPNLFPGLPEVHRLAAALGGEAELGAGDAISITAEVRVSAAALRVASEPAERQLHLQLDLESRQGSVILNAPRSRVEIARVTGSNALTVSEGEVPPGADVRWEDECPLDGECVRRYRISIRALEPLERIPSGDVGEGDVKSGIRWRLLAELRYMPGREIPRDAVITIVSPP